jgi:hypothetical protein
VVCVPHQPPGNKIGCLISVEIEKKERGEERIQMTESQLSPVEIGKVLIENCQYRQGGSQKES